MKKNVTRLFAICALTAPLFLGSCAPKAENKQADENEVKTEEPKTMKAESAVFVYENETDSVLYRRYWNPSYSSSHSNHLCCQR